MIDQGKYIVFKREDWESVVMCIPSEHNRERAGEWALDDAIVIRRKDTFAPSALYAYATSVLSAVEILEDHGGHIEPEELQRLTELADYFAGQADQARQQHGKIPD